MSAAPRTGSLVGPAPFQPTIRTPDIDARSAMSEALVEFLRCVEFRRWGDQAPDVVFRLDRIYRQWPEPDVLLTYPSASVIDMQAAEESPHNLVPTPLEDTIDLIEPCSVMWKTAELVTTFQVDFWAEDDPTREAIAATLPMVFGSSESRYGVVVYSPPTYWSRPVRLSLLSSQRMDDTGSVYVRERRLMVRMQAEVDEVHLRRATLSAIRVSVPEVGEQVQITSPPAGYCDRE